MRLCRAPGPEAAGAIKEKENSKMTLNDIVASALAQLGRGNDPQTVEGCMERFAWYANDAQAELAQAVGLKRTETITPEEGRVELAGLSRPCLKVLSAKQRGEEVRFVCDGLYLLLPYEDEPAEVAYRCEPRRLELPADVSELPEVCHGLMVGYVVARERMAADVSTQRGSNIYLSMFEAAKARLAKLTADPEGYRLVNRY